MTKDLLPELSFDRPTLPDPIGGQLEIEPLQPVERRPAHVPLRYVGKPRPRSADVPWWGVVVVLACMAWAVFRHGGMDIDCHRADGSVTCVLVERPAPWNEQGE